MSGGDEESTLNLLYNTSVPSTHRQTITLALVSVAFPGHFTFSNSTEQFTLNTARRSVVFDGGGIVGECGRLTLSPPIPSRLYTLPYWSNPPFLTFDIRALWRSGLSARAPECQKLKIVG